VRSKIKVPERVPVHNRENGNFPRLG